MHIGTVHHVDGGRERKKRRKNRGLAGEFREERRVKEQHSNTSEGGCRGALLRTTRRERKQKVGFFIRRKGARQREHERGAEEKDYSDDRGETVDKPRKKRVSATPSDVESVRGSKPRGLDAWF